MSNIQKFNDLHDSQELLFLGNAWDVLSALILEKAGFQAIGTTSWGIANSLGHADGELIDFQRHLAIIQAITAQVNIPVSADIEAGYGHDEQCIIDNVLRTADVGVAGINIEDSFKHQVGLRSLTEHCHLLTNMRSMLDNRGYQNFFINARTDTYFQVEQPYQETMTRAMAYVESGASGVFIPGLTDVDEIRAITSNVDAPINLLSLPGLTNCQTLKELGVRRMSFGNALSDKIIAYLTAHTAQLVKDQDTSSLYV
ncbi:MULTISPECIES: isocitrate lyase/PEP mutase family protein [Lysinibacillus]|uniref:isocitrate lyase/PEP mutase family protein n=1 Tax=Lysinibacillus TaxID=400634 RepID=UPI0005027061|nr:MULTISPECIES: isocitrate lyase/phosphoenolpyruvate mutase family protein [Lysinibacillus]KGA83207.1 carboxyphosphonoenolpyruvate phosphonomutase [Lysinibacillus fusiformis]UXJ70295.1 isocitrate lyase/phosphoenolpyruvate mutase family protein [Lysinibacillus fusiformis]